MDDTLYGGTVKEEFFRTSPMPPQPPQEVQTLLHFGADLVHLDRPNQGVVSPHAQVFVG